MDEDIMQQGLRDMRKDSKLLKYWSELKDTDDAEELREKIYSHILKYHYYAAETMYEFNDRIASLEDKQFKKRKTVVATINQQLLLLDYLRFFTKNDIFNSITSNEKKARFLGILIDRSSDNIDKSLPMLNTGIRTISNLEFVKKVFEDAGLIEIAKDIQEEIERLKRIPNKK